MSTDKSALRTFKLVDTWPITYKTKDIRIEYSELLYHKTFHQNMGGIQKRLMLGIILVSKPLPYTWVRPFKEVPLALAFKFRPISFTWVKVFVLF